MKCCHCGEEIGNTDEYMDEYELYEKHINSCNSEIAKKYRESLEEEEYV